MRSTLFSILAGALLGSVCVSSLPAQALPYPPGVYPVFVDSRGDTIPSNPANIPFKVINGFPEYIVGPGDVLDITTVEGGVRKTEASRILPDGTVTFSILNNVPVAGLSLSEAVETFTRTLSRYVRNPQVQVLIKDYFNKYASVLGAINTATASLLGGRTGPGVYPLKGRVTALEQILQAGGPTADARLDQVRLIRGNRTYIIDLQRAISAGDNRQNPVLEHGDVIQVPGIGLADRRVAVLGEVRQPGVFNLSTEANMLEAIAASNGFTQDASANRIRVIRAVDPINPEIITVNAERILKGDLSQNVGLEDGDIVVVPRDWLTDLNDLLVQISPILNWGGLIITEPVVRVGGYDINTGTGGGGAALPGATAGAGALPAETLTTEQQVIDQVQRNLRKPALPRKSDSRK